MKFTYWTLIIGVTVAMFFVGRCSAPQIIDTHQHEIDSLTRRANKAEMLMRYSDDQAKLAYARGLTDEKAKIIHHTIFRVDTTHNHAYRKMVKDSLIKAWFAMDPTMDSSMFSEPVADGVLDLKSENKMLKADDASDASAISNLKEAYHAKDSALVACGDALKDVDGLVTIARANEARAKKEVKKQKFLKWVGLGLAGVFALLASTR